MPGHALVVSHTNLQRDPRVRREVEWLTAEGWSVDTVGLGPAALDGVREHFEFRAEKPWLRFMGTKAFVHVFLPQKLKFTVLFGHRIAREMYRKLADDSYDLVLINDIVLLPIIQHLPRTAARVHLDLHEYFPPHLGKHLRGWWLGTPLRKWTRRFISDARIRSRSTVARGIAELYRDEFGVPEPQLIKNCPPREDLSPSPVDSDTIDLVYHGAAAWERGLRCLIDAMGKLPERFRLHLMLVASHQGIDEVEAAIAPLGDRARLVPPVAVDQIASRINEFDLEVMFYPPTTENLRFALPNKLFEAIQARLGVVIGESPMMADVVHTYGNGTVVSGWHTADLVAALSHVTPNDVRAYKQGSVAAAAELNAENEHKKFLALVSAFDN
ncbi:glycosyltransferase [Microbacterium sp. YY-01]|uniref:glycosyltransferase n=1 Tax=Microbacterium sp. YY-01 TaxID=3421634 RepID=UPI003D1719FB